MTTNDDQWSFIKELIDQCDYYIVVIGARYGSTSTDGLSFTEKEYRYAIEKGIPVIGFVHAQPELIPQGRAETQPESREKLKEFIQLVRSKLCKEWSTPAELGAVVSRSLTQLIKRNPRPGWVRSDKLASAEANEEILRLHKLLEKKDEEISRYGFTQSLTAKGLAQGADLVELTYSVYLTDPTLAYNTQRTSRHTAEIKLTWDEIYKSFAPHLLTPAKLSTIKSGINSLVREKELEHIQTLFPELNIGTFSISNTGLQMMIVQFTALAYLEIFNKEDADGKSYKIAGLTPQGRSYLLNASAIKRGEIARANFAPHDGDANIDD
jgi:hypothetical protein